MLRHILAAAALTLLPARALAAEPVQVMIVGMFHMNNPGRDMHNVHADDVLAPARQAEIARIDQALLPFAPTLVAVEWPSDIANQRYGEYLKGTLKPSRDESVQLGFRLARSAGLTHVEGIDADGDFPYEAVDAYAKAHAMEGLLATANTDVQAMVDKENALLAHDGIAAALRYLNAPSRITGDNGFYRTMLKVGGGSEQPGAELLTQWYHRNFVICANLVQRIKPGDRAVVFYGAGHGFPLRQCISEMPGFKLVEANDYLPK
jgi:hypothetical protein